MNEFLERFGTYLSAVVRYRWYVFLVTTVCCLVGWTLIGMMPDKYRATGRIYVDTKSVLQPLLKGLAVEPDVAQEIGAMQQSLLSRPNLEEVARRTGLDPGDLNREQYEDLILRLRRAIDVDVGGQSIFTIDVVYTDAAKASEIAQALIDVFVDSNVGLSREDMEQAGRFLDQQIGEYERQLEAAESRGAAFKQENLAYLPSAGGFQTGLDAARQRESSIAGELREARTELDVLKTEMAITPQTIEPGSQPLAKTTPLGEMQARLADMLTRYTENHPDVIALRRTIEEMQRTGRGAMPADTGAAPTLSFASIVVPNAAFAALKLRVIDKEAEVAKLQERLKLAREDVRDLESRAYQVPQIEAQMTKLDRDYEVLKNQYEQMLERREQARLARDREESGDKVQFRVVDPPQVPVLPQGPHRPLLLTAVLAIAFAAGIGFAVALSLLRGTYTNARQLRDDFGLPVIGAVSFVTSRLALGKQRAEAAALVLLSAGVLATYVLLMVVEYQVGLGKVVGGVIESTSLWTSVELVSHGTAALSR